MVPAFQTVDLLSPLARRQPAPDSKDSSWDLLGVSLLLTHVINPGLESGDPAPSVHGFHSW